MQPQLVRHPLPPIIPLLPNRTNFLITTKEKEEVERETSKAESLPRETLMT